MFIAMNHFSVRPGREAEFEERWRQRQSYLASVPGFVQFALLKGDNPGEYVSHSTWRDRAAFVGWTQSDAFVAGHRQGSVADILTGPPQVKLYEALLVEPSAAVTAG
jgi:heme-degrading monooxygenase HmoA